MIDIKTGKHFNAPPCELSPISTGGKEAAVHTFTRRSALKGLAAIIAAGVSPSLCGSITRGLGYRNLGGRLAAMCGAGESFELFAEVSNVYGWNNVKIQVVLANGSSSGTATYPDGEVHTFTPSSLVYTKAITIGRISFSNDFSQISFSGDNNSRSIIGFTSKHSKLSHVPYLYGAFHLRNLELVGDIGYFNSQTFMSCGEASNSGLTIDLTETNINSIPNNFSRTNANVIKLNNITSLPFQCFSYTPYLREVCIYAPVAPSLVAQTFRDAGTSVTSGVQKVVKVPVGATGYNSSAWINATTGGGTEGSGWEIQYVL